MLHDEEGRNEDGEGTARAGDVEHAAADEPPQDAMMHGGKAGMGGKTSGGKRRERENQEVRSTQMLLLYHVLLLGAQSCNRMVGSEAVWHLIFRHSS